MFEMSATGKLIAKCVGGLIVAYKLAGEFDETLVAHLTTSFATKTDLQRVEDKLDLVLDRLPSAKKR